MAKKFVKDICISCDKRRLCTDFRGNPHCAKCIKETEDQFKFDKEGK